MRIKNIGTAWKGLSCLGAERRGLVGSGEARFGQSSYGGSDNPNPFIFIVAECQGEVRYGSVRGGWVWTGLDMIGKGSRT